MTQIKPKAFNIYFDTYEHIQLLTMEQRGELFTALYEFAANGVCTDFTDNGLRIALSFMRAQIKRDFVKYEEKCLKLRENGNKGGRPSKKENQKNQLVL